MILKKPLLLLGTLVLLVGCSSQPDTSKLREGMLEADVVALLGKPDQVDDQGQALLKIKSMAYTRYDPNVIVMIKDGKAAMAVVGSKPMFGADQNR
jgi:hypothetical protein